MSISPLRLFVAAVLLSALPAAHAASVREIFEKYDLIGNFAVDCSSPPSPQNLFIVHRVLGADLVQRDAMIDGTTRRDASVVDSASESKAGEITISLNNEQRRLKLVVRVDRKRIQTVESVRENGDKLIANGRSTTDNADVPWLNKCG
jgi:hypothetical protein